MSSRTVKRQVLKKPEKEILVLKENIADLRSDFESFRGVVDRFMVHRRPTILDMFSNTFYKIKERIQIWML